MPRDMMHSDSSCFFLPNFIWGLSVTAADMHSNKFKIQKPFGLLSTKFTASLTLFF